jgi:hypothetical protein
VRRAILRVLVVAVVGVVAGWLLLVGVAGAAGDASETGCPRETESSPGFRGYLPGCDAFELVSPPYIGGGFLGWKTFRTELPPMSADGEHILALVFAGFAETEDLEQSPGLEYGAVYEFSRTPAGWAAEALAPPASLYPHDELKLVSADLSRSLWLVRKPPVPGEELPFTEDLNYESDGTLVLREAAGGGKGRFTEVGPVVAPGHEPNEFRGFLVRSASADLGQVLLSVTSELRQLWPGDGTREGDASLYEYSGTGEREPVLVGVGDRAGSGYAGG